MPALTSVYLRVDGGRSTSVIDEHSRRDVIRRLPLAGAEFGALLSEDLHLGTNDYFSLHDKTTNRLTFSLADSAGTLLETGGCPWSFSLVITRYGNNE